MRLSAQMTVNKAVSLIRAANFRNMAEPMSTIDESAHLFISKRRKGIVRKINVIFPSFRILTVGLSILMRNSHIQITIPVCQDPSIAVENGHEDVLRRQGVIRQMQLCFFLFSRGHWQG